MNFKLKNLLLILLAMACLTGCKDQKKAGNGEQSAESSDSITLAITPAMMIEIADSLKSDSLYACRYFADKNLEQLFEENYDEDIDTQAGWSAQAWGYNVDLDKEQFPEVTFFKPRKSDGMGLAITQFDEIGLQLQFFDPAIKDQVIKEIETLGFVKQPEDGSGYIYYEKDDSTRFTLDGDDKLNMWRILY